MHTRAWHHSTPLCAALAVGGECMDERLCGAQMRGGVLPCCRTHLHMRRTAVPTPTRRLCAPRPAWVYYRGGQCRVRALTWQPSTLRCCAPIVGHAGTRDATRSSRSTAPTMEELPQLSALRATFDGRMASLASRASSRQSTPRQVRPASDCAALGPSREGAERTANQRTRLVKTRRKHRSHCCRISTGAGDRDRDRRPAPVPVPVRCRHTIAPPRSLLVACWQYCCTLLAVLLVVCARGGCAHRRPSRRRCRRPSHRRCRRPSHRRYPTRSELLVG